MTKFVRAVTHPTTHPPTQRCSPFKCAQRSCARLHTAPPGRASTPRCCGARGRRAGSASSWRIGDAAVVIVPPDPGQALRLSLERGGGGGTEECRRAAGLVARSKRAVGQRAEPRRGAEAAGRRGLADSSTCSPTGPTEHFACWLLPGAPLTLVRLAGHCLLARAPTRSSTLFSPLLPPNP
jgi:hypothetical protein